MREFGSEFHIAHHKDGYFEQLKHLKAHYAFLRTGREALLLASKASEGRTILMPAYCCWSMEAPFIQEGYRIIYYRLNTDLSVDTDYMLDSIEKHNPSAVLVVNYYGFTPTNNIVNRIKQINHNILVIEDFSHCLFSLNELFNPAVDCYVASIRKSIGLPDGAIYLSDIEPTEIAPTNDTDEFLVLRNQAERLKNIYQYTASQQDKSNFLAALSQAGQLLKNEDVIYPREMSKEGQNIVHNTCSNSFRMARMCNYEHLYNIIANNPLLHIPFSPQQTHTAPFALPILVDDRDSVQQMFAANGIYAPVLWPITKEASRVCPNAQNYSEHMLALPIDQRYNYYDIEELGHRIISILK